MTTTMQQACIGEPVSWLRLETFALDPRDANVRDHVAACPACKQCLDEIERDVVALPPLVVPARKARRPWWQFALPAGLAIAAAAILLLVIRPRGETQRSNELRVKGVGVVVLDIVGERAGAIRSDARTFREGDRFKLVVTCPPDRTAHFELRVREAGTLQIDRPLAPADLVCGNRVVMPGAFTLTGVKANEVCVDVTGPLGDLQTACVTLRPE
jgi:hypothetical protein